MPVVNNLRKFRENMDLKQSDVSTAVMTSPNTISRYEIGKQCPTLEMALRLSDYYGKTVNELFQLDK